MVAQELVENNVQVLKRCEELVNEHYKEPVKGLFNNIVVSVLKHCYPTSQDQTRKLTLESDCSRV